MKRNNVNDVIHMIARRFLDHLDAGRWVSVPAELHALIDEDDVLSAEGLAEGETPPERELAASKQKLAEDAVALLVRQGAAKARNEGGVPEICRPAAGGETDDGVAGEVLAHELAGLFPDLTDEEYEELKESIAANGLREPIVRYQGKILDGRARYRACRELGIKPDFVKWDGGSAAEFVADKNLVRRHLTTSQRSMIAADLKEKYQAGAAARMRAGMAPDPLADMPRGPARDLAARDLKVSSRSVGHAEKVKRDGIPELGKAVRQGRVKVAAAAEIAGLPPDEQQAALAGGKSACAAGAKKAKEAKKKKRATGGRQKQPQDTAPAGAATPSVKSSPAPRGEVLGASDLSISSDQAVDDVARRLVDAFGQARARELCAAIRKGLASAVTEKKPRQAKAPVA
jgi:ParB-like chromosome segregation protein Spo0J